jgi:hypothetical protein
MGVEEPYDKSIVKGAPVLLRRTRIATLLLLMVVFTFHPVLAEAQVKQIDPMVCQDFVKQCIGPAVNKAVDAYYGEKRRVAYWQMDILDIKRISKGSYWFEITVRVKTSKGSLNPPYGIETITLSNMTKPGEGDYKVIRFVHGSSLY